jgi:hypothetical protein
VGESIGIGWPGGDFAIGALIAGYFVVAHGAVAYCRALPGTDVNF